MIEAIHALRAREIAAAEAGDVESLLELRTENFVAMPPGQPPVRGIPPVRDFLEVMFAAGSLKETLTSEDAVVAGEWAYDRGTFKGEVTMASTGATVPVDGKYLWIVRQQPDGSWRYAVQMWSDNQGSPGS